MIKLCQVTDLNKTKDLYCNKIKSHFIRKCFIRLRLDKASTYSTRPINVCETCNKEMNTKHIIIGTHPLEVAPSVEWERSNFVNGALIEAFLEFISVYVVVNEVMWPTEVYNCVPYNCKRKTFVISRCTSHLLPKYCIVVERKVSDNEVCVVLHAISQIRVVYRLLFLFL